MPEDSPPSTGSPEPALTVQPSEETRRVRRRSSKRRSESRQHFTPTQRPRWETWALGIIPLVLIFVGGGNSLLVKSLASLALGALLVVSPPNYRLPKTLLLALLMLLLAPLAAYLPSVWVGVPMEWRTSLQEHWGISLPATATPQPWLTFESWLGLATGIAWLAWCTSRGSTLDDRRLIFRLLVIGLSLIAGLTLLDHAEILQIPWWSDGKKSTFRFGPFTNRNHTSSLLAVASVLCAAVAFDAHRRKERKAVLFLLPMAVFFAAILTNTSRAGLVLFFIGTTLWLWTAAMRKGFVKKAALAASLVLAGVSLIFLFGGKMVSRFATADGSAAPLANSVHSRTELYRDAISMTSQSPWTGIGLGNFNNVYPQFGTLAEPATRFHHPESDFIWLLAEGGMLSFIACFALLGCFITMTGPWITSPSQESSSRQDRRLRNAAAIGAMVIFLHAWVDVPMHVASYAIIAVLLLALAVRPSRCRTPAGLADKSVFRLTGLLILTAGCVWLAISFGRPILPGAASARLLAARSMDLSHANRDAEALELVNRAIAMNPLDYTQYFSRAQIHLRLKHSDQTALADFARARALEPHYSFFCMQEGDIWFARGNLSMAIPAWREALQRNPKEGTYWFQVMREKIPSNPALVDSLSRLATTPMQKVIFLYGVHSYSAHAPEAFPNMLNRLLNEPPGLAGLDAKYRLEVFRLWQIAGDRAKLKEALEKNLTWQIDGWPVLAEERARLGDYEGAYRLAVHYEPSPVNPTTTSTHDLGQLEQSFLFNPTDPRRGIDLYFALRARNQLDQAMATLEKIAKLPNAPVYVTHEMASVYAVKSDYRKAWELISKYLVDRNNQKINEPEKIEKVRRKVRLTPPEI